MSSDIDEFYILRAESRGQMPRGDDRAAGGFVNPGGVLGPLTSALRFDTLEQAERYAAGHDTGNYRWLIQLCSRESRETATDDGLHRLIERIMDIPQPYRRSAYNWLRGKDVPTLLRRQGEEVYRRHRKVLAQHDIDITRPSEIVLMRPKRGRLVINTGNAAIANGPRQYVALPAQRLSVAPALRDDESSEED